MLASLLLAALPLVAAPLCGSGNFLDTAEHFALASLALNPVEAGQTGYHVHEGTSLDTQLDDLSPASIAAQEKLFRDAKQCFARFTSLSGEDAADLASLENTIDANLYDLDTVQSYHHRPQDVAEMIGSGLFFPLTETNGTEQERMAAVLARMQQVPKALDQARANLREADPVFIDAAVEETEGDEELLTQIGTMVPAGSPLRPRYDAAVKPAQKALAAYITFLKDDLSKRAHTLSWRAGPEEYGHIFSLSLGPGATDTPASVLAAAEQDLARIRAEMYTLALPLHKQYYPQDKHDDLKGAALENQVIAEVLDRINDDHTTPDHLLDQVRSQVGAIRGFIAAKDLLTLSSNDNMKVVPTPAFLRGSFSVAGFHSAPALEPAAEAEYWVTPLDGSTPKQAESKLREYNNWMLQYLTMHEALPGHYTQFEHANTIKPPQRRLLRALFGNGAYAEGWGEYGVKEMEDAGYANHDPRFVLMVLKIRLRVVANAILDIRMQSMGMTDEEALALMEGQAFQTHAEATGKLRRAKLTAGQLITYYVGFHQWIDLRAACEKAAGPSFSLKRFNDAALDEGPLAIPLLKPLLLAGPECGATSQSSPAPRGSPSSR